MKTKLSNHKIQEDSARNLETCEEIVGVPTKIIQKEEQITLTLSCPIRINIPANKKLTKELYKKIGHKIGILHLEGESYILRDAEVKE